MEDYCPEVIIGVEHVMDSVDHTCRLLESRLMRTAGFKVGIESYEFPVYDTQDCEEFAPFFNEVGNYVIDAGGQIVSLVTPEANRMFEESTRIALEVVREADAIINTLHPSESVFPVLSRGNKCLFTSLRDWILHKRLQHGSLNFPIIDLAIMDSVRKHKPQAIVVGAGHLPPLAYEFPRAKRQFVLGGKKFI